MELYRRFPKFCAGWCFLEIFVFAGQLFGWTSIQFVLNREGFYSDLCETIDTRTKCLTDLGSQVEDISAQIDMLGTDCETAYFLASEDSDFISGQCINVDGGALNY